MNQQGERGLVRGQEKPPRNKKVTPVPAADEIRQASEHFYAALNRMLNGNAGPLADIWSHSAAVTTMHPIGGREVGWDKVGQAWEQVAKVFSAGQVKLNDQFIQVAGDMAYEVGTEQGQAMLGGQQVAIEHRVTNIYRREAGAWKIVHHHTDVSPAMADALSRLQVQR
jgi:ketosteroid isomerase-like protein